MSVYIRVSELQRFAVFIKSLRERGRKDQTLCSYQSAHRAVAGYYYRHNGEPFSLEKFSGLDLRHFKSVSLEETRSPRTINHRIIFARHYVSWAEHHGDVAKEQAASIRAVPLLPIVPLGPRVPAPDELRRLLRHVELNTSKRDQAMIWLLLNGLRESEVAGLRLGDLALTSSRGNVRVHGEHVKGSSTRTVPLTRQARLALQSYICGRDGNGLVFIGERGPITVDGIYKCVKRLGRAVGLDIHPHTFRRQFAREYHAKNPHDLLGLKLLMGHASLETLARSYLGKSVNDLEDGIEKLSL